MRRLTAIAPLAALLAATAAGPASGITTSHSTTVRLDASVGSRQFFVEDLRGSDLTSLSIERDGKQPFRVRVVDANFGTVAQDYQIDATLNNLYKGGSATSSAKISSSAFSIGFGASKLAASGVSFPVEPSYLVSGTIPSCLTLQGLSADLSSLSLTSPLCLLLGSGGQTVSDLPVTGIVKTVVPTASQLANLTDLPVQLAGATGGTFTLPDYKNGIGALDTSGGGAAGTPIGLMTGNAELSAALVSIIKSALPVASTPLTAADDVGAKVPLASLTSTLAGSASATLSELGRLIAELSLTQQSAILNQLAGTLVEPTLSTIQELTGTYSSFPILTANATVPETGTYSGTLTVTFVQTP